jgi:hypothetical protein
VTTAASPQFGTTAQVTIVPPFGPGITINPDLTPGVSQGRVDWSVTKGVGQSNTCSIRGYNLGKTSRDRAGGIIKRVIDFSDEFAFLDGRLVEGVDLGGTSTVSTANGFGSLTLKARYQGSSTTASLFEGTAVQVRSKHRRDTWVTTLTGDDGVMQSTSAIADKVWTSTVPSVEVLDYLVRQVMVASLATPYPPQLAAYAFVGGYDASNYFATDILDQLTALTKTQWWWDDGEVFFSALGQPMLTPPIVLSSSGAPGTTKILDKPQPTEDGKVIVPSLLLPEMRPMSPVTVIAEALGGSYFASTVQHNGSTRGGVSRTVATLTPIGVVPFL